MGRTAISQHDSPLGRWTRAFYFPDPPLADHVQLFWHVSGRANYLRDRRLPTGNAHLLFNLCAAPTLFAREPGGPSRSFPTCWLAGQSETVIETGSHGDTVLLGAQFHSRGAYRPASGTARTRDQSSNSKRCSATRCSVCANACSTLLAADALRPARAVVAAPARTRSASPPRRRRSKPL
jgi:hypothetical protein